MEKAYTIVQITDPHLHGTSDGTLLGMNTENSLKLILDRVNEEVTDIDLVIATGDIAQQSSIKAYSNFLSFVSVLNAPMRWIPGNHDNRIYMAEAAAGKDHGEPCYTLGNWVVILLDSMVPGKVYGNLADDQLDLMEALLQKHSDKHALITLHHHAVLMKSLWLDQHNLKNSDELIARVNKHSNVKAVVCGHVHQASENNIGGVRYISTPSTCVQFLPASEDFGIDSIGPGYRKLVLNADGTIDTSITRIEEVDFEIDYTQKGY